ncbi:hypothetical protein D3C81_1940240 [compost metagenome]
MLQAGLIAFTGGRVRIVDFGPIDFLKSINGADGADQLKVGVIAEQVASKIEGQRRNTVGRHEIPHLQAHLLEISIRQGILILLIFKAQHRVLIICSMVGLAAGNAQANNR